MTRQTTPQHSGAAISILKVQPRRDDGIVLTSDAIGVDGSIDPRYSADGENISPPLSWDQVADAGAYALIVEDPDAPREQPFVHWLIWNIPGEATSMFEAVPPRIHPVTPQGAVQGRNDAGQTGYMGPKPPPGHGVNHYYFQLFALDGLLEIEPDADIRTLVDAIKGRTIVQGELVGTFETLSDFDSPARSARPAEIPPA
jgi:Raf kinase inhibitor-like YbhB/YbcL family protein